MPPRRDRIVELAAAILVIAIPLLLIVATWEPLESLPRQSGARALEQDVSDEAGPPEMTVNPPRGRKAKKASAKEKAPVAAPSAATPDT